jgi:hypothetical protein
VNLVVVVVMLVEHDAVFVVVVVVLVTVMHIMWIVTRQELSTSLMTVMLKLIGDRALVL